MQIKAAHCHVFPDYKSFSNVITNKHGVKNPLWQFSHFAGHHSITAGRENHSRELFVGAADDLGMKLMQALRSENSECSEICWKYESL